MRILPGIGSLTLICLQYVNISTASPRPRLLAARGSVTSTVATSTNSSNQTSIVTSTSSQSHGGHCQTSFTSIFTYDSITPSLTPSQTSKRCHYHKVHRKCQQPSCEYALVCPGFDKCDDSSGTASGPAATTASASTVATPYEEYQQSTSSGLSESSKLALGIGIGIGVPVLILSALGLFFLLRSGRYQHLPPSGRNEPTGTKAGGLQYTNTPVSEMRGTRGSTTQGWNRRLSVGFARLVRSATPPTDEDEDEIADGNHVTRESYIASGSKGPVSPISPSTARESRLLPPPVDTTAARTQVGGGTMRSSSGASRPSEPVSPISQLSRMSSILSTSRRSERRPSM